MKVLRAHAQIWREPYLWCWGKNKVLTFSNIAELRAYAKKKGKKLKLSIEYLKEVY